MTATASDTLPRIDGLRQRHESLDERIRELRGHPSADELEIKALKLAKLRVKEELTALRA